MGTKVIAGCFNKANGKVTFADEACDGTTDYEGCFVASGVHAGQIQVTIIDEQCNDTYWGCLDPTNSPPSFEVTIPDDCCIVAGDDCEHCDGETPLYHTVTFSGMTICPCLAGLGQSLKHFDCDDAVNGVALRVTQDGGSCWWDEYTYADFGYERSYTDEIDCTGDYIDTDLTSVLVRLLRTATDVGCRADLNPGLQYIFNGADYGTSVDCCDGASISNDYDVGDCASYEYCMYGGSATVVEGDMT
jgi:hypothetical protein